MLEKRFQTITEYCQFMERPKPAHPLFYFYRSDNPQMPSPGCAKEPLAMVRDFYMISIKDIISGEVVYGRTKYDCDSGTVLLTAPGQKIIYDKLVVSGHLTNIYFHEDFIKGHELHDEIKKYGYFSYSVNEALHLFGQEEQQLESVLTVLETESNGSYDDLSRNIMLSQLHTLLHFINRFYRRQFLYRKEMAGDMYSRFMTTLRAYYDTGKPEEKGAPGAKDIAASLGVSARYLSDSLKAETGMTASEQIHRYLIDEAKNLLLEPGVTVGEVAYQLGFEYPQYFSRLFKNKEGISPTEYRNNYLS